VYCNAWLGGRTRDDPRRYADELADCAVRALVVGRPRRSTAASRTAGPAVEGPQSGATR
jgi:hypothetical protein